MRLPGSRLRAFQLLRSPFLPALRTTPPMYAFELPGSARLSDFLGAALTRLFDDYEIEHAAPPKPSTLFPTSRAPRRRASFPTP